MNKFFVFCTFFLSLGACSPVKESFIDIETGEKIAGYDKDCTYVIGITSQAEVKQESNKDIVFLFADEPRQIFPAGKLIAVGGGADVITKKGIKAGDPVEKALKAYGKPKARVIDYGKDENARIHWIFYGLFYDNLSLLTDESYKQVLGIIIGRQKELDINLQKQYARK